MTVENKIYQLVNRLMEIFEVEQPALGQQWAEQLITSTKRPDHYVKPLSVSLDEIQAYRGSSGIKDLFNELRLTQGELRGVDGILHLASRLGSDDSTRKFIKIHNLLRVSKRRKEQQQHQQQYQQQTQPRNQPAASSNSPPMQSQYYQTPITNHRHAIHNQQTHLQKQSYTNGFQATMVPPANIPQSAKPMRHVPMRNTPQVPPQDQHQQSNIQNNNQLYMFQTPLRVDPSTRQAPQHDQPTQPHDMTTSMIAITPASYKKRDKSRRSDVRRKHDVLYQKMKNFLAENQFLSFDFKKIDWTQMCPITPLSSMSIQEQESALINDLLYVLIGTEGKYIRMQPSRESPNKHTIGVERGGDELVYTSATRIIKICPLYSTVVHYAEDVNFGLVNQALAAPIRDLVKEYLSLISNLQLRALRDDMTLQSMWLSLQTIFYRMEALKQIIDQISRDSCYGGHTLSILHNRVVNFSTDPKTHEFCLKLMQAASEPYFEILERWLYLGIIEDPYGEFFIEDTENKSDSRGLFNNSSNRAANTQSKQHPDVDTFWRKRFTRDESKVPQFLKSKQDKIFDTGKHLSVVRQYGKKIFRPLSYEPMTYCPELRKYDERIEEAYKFASKELLDLLLVENKLIDRLYSLKRYFLFSSGDFFVQFMDMADEELSKTKDDINMARLESLLELALRTSSCNNDPYKDDVHIKMSEVTLFQYMSRIDNTEETVLDSLSRTDTSHSSGSLLGWESLTLSYDVSWPLSMIICKEYCQELYQMMFRHLFCCKYIERKLEATWRINRLLRFNNYEGAFALRHKMLHFVHNLLYYIIEIIEPSFQILISKFKDSGIENVNEVIELHKAFLSGLVHDSMLTDNELLGYVTKLLLLCLDFSVVIEAKFAQQEQQRLEDQALNSRSRSINNLTCIKTPTIDETDAKYKRPTVVVRAMTTENSSSPQGESYVASQIRKLSLTTQHNQQQQNSTRMPKSESIGNLKSKSTNPDDVFQARIADINEKFNKQLMILLDALTKRSQDFSASSKLQDILYRLDFNFFYKKSDLAS